MAVETPPRGSAVAPAEEQSLKLGQRSPALNIDETKPVMVADTWYPGAMSITEVGVVEDWLEHAEQALVEARNGVTAISWPLAFGSLLALLTLMCDAVDDGLDRLWTATGWASLITQHPSRWMICMLLVALTVAAFKVAGSGADERRRLVQVRASYLRRRRELRATRLPSGCAPAGRH